MEMPIRAAQENINGGSMDISSPSHTIADSRPTMHKGSGSRQIHHDGDEGHHDTNKGGEYAFSGGLRNLDLVAAPPPQSKIVAKSKDTSTRITLRHEYLGNFETRCRIRGKSPVFDCRPSIGSVNAPQGHAPIPVETTMSGTLDVEESYENRLASELLMDRIQYLVWHAFPFLAP